MKFCPLLFLLVFVILNRDCFTASEESVCEESAYPPDNKDLIPLYVVNLDLSPLQRWAPLIIDKRHMLHKLVDDVKELLESLAGEKIFTTLMKNLDSLAATLPYPYYEEIVGIAGYSNLPPSVITLYNVFYEVFTLCTSILAQDPDGNIVHGRNLDTGVFLGWDKKNKTWKVAELLHPLTVHLQFKKEGKVIFESTSFAGYVGILTAVRKGCIITRDRDHSDLLNLWTTANGSGSWYLVQTNYDHWKQPPFFDDRRTPANWCMVEGGATNASLRLIYNVLSTKPVLNKETIYTTLMSAKSGEFSSWLRYCPDPCWPW
ncbi:acid ceramidase-like isoform X5 [Macrobrachium rosenbergii]|uniref:acid ceramidase-like isoform X5 n=1 Tax=Macrobrachium rosenbergii TaxID=79674 RepID=UPI0034D40DF0